MHEVEQNSLLEEAELLLEEVVRAFFDGDMGRAAQLAHAAYLKVGKAQDANPTREGIVTLVSLYELLSEALVSLDEMRYAREWEWAYERV